MPLSDADKIINLEDLAAFKAKMDESVLHKIGTETVSGEKVFSGSQSTAAGNESALIVVKDPNLVKGETPETNHYLSLGFIDSTGNSYAQDTASRLAVVEYKSPSEADPEGYAQIADAGFNGGGSARIRVGHDENNIRYATAPSTSEDRTGSTDIVTRDYLPKSKAIPQFPDLWNWQKTEKASAVTVKPVPESDLEPVVDFLFTETPPAEGAKGPDNPSTIMGVSEVKVSTKGSNLFCIPPQTRTMYGVDMTIGEDGIITFDGASTFTAGNNFGIRVDFPFNVKCSPGMTLKLSFIPVSGSATSVMSDRPYNAGFQQGIFNSDGSVLRYTNCTDAIQNYTYTIPVDIYDSYIGPRQYLYIDKGASFDNYKFKINVELLTDVGWDVPAAWNNYAIELGGAFYGGSLDVATGMMTVTHASLLFNGSTNFSDSGFSERESAYQLRLYPSPARSMALPSAADVACDRLSATPGGIGSSTTPGFYFSANSASVNLLVSKTDIGVSDGATKAAVQTAVNAWFAAYPATLVYPVASPSVVQLTPTQILSLPALDKYEPRINTVYTDQQAVQVGYQKYAGGAVKALGTTVARTLPERFADVVNVKDYGAKGDGATDDSSAVSAAISDAASKNAALLFPAGTYALGSQSFGDSIHSIPILGDGVLLTGGYNFPVSARRNETANNAPALYVSASGNDSNSGLSVSYPFATLQKAFDVYKKQYANKGYLYFNIIVAAGIYYQHASLIDCVSETRLQVIGAGRSETVFTGNGDSVISATTPTIDDFIINFNACPSGRVTVKNLSAINSGLHGIIFQNKTNGYVVDCDAFNNYYGDITIAEGNLVLQGEINLGQGSRWGLRAYNNAVISFSEATGNELSISGCSEAGIYGRENSFIWILGDAVIDGSLTGRNEDCIYGIELVKGCYSEVRTMTISNYRTTGVWLDTLSMLDNTQGTFVIETITGDNDFILPKFIERGFSQMRSSLYLTKFSSTNSIFTSIVGSSSVDGNVRPSDYALVIDSAHTNGIKFLVDAPSHVNISRQKDSDYINQNINFNDSGIFFNVSNLDKNTLASAPSLAEYGMYPTYFIPKPNETKNCGTASFKWLNVYSKNGQFNNLYSDSGSVSISDARLKSNVAEVSDKLMSAWGKVRYVLFQFNDALEKKGEEARIHAGVLAQEVQEAFASEGLDASRYGLFCYDEWEDEYMDEEVIDADAVYDEDGNEVSPRQAHVERRLVRAAGNKYGIRYEEALALECAYQRWLGEKRDARIAELEARLA